MNEITFECKLRSIALGSYSSYTASKGKNKGTEGTAFDTDKGTVFLTRKLKFPAEDEAKIAMMKKLNVFKIIESGVLVAAEGMEFTKIKGWDD